MKTAQLRLATLLAAIAAAASFAYAAPDGTIPDGDALPRESAPDSVFSTPSRARAPRPRSAPVPLSARDTDHDGYTDNLDNCPTIPNPPQRDMDGDGIGDNCDDDVDGDGIANGLDNCPFIPNVAQRDMDGDGIGDVADSDADGDGIPNWDDAYPLDARSSATIVTKNSRVRDAINEALMRSTLARVLSGNAQLTATGSIDLKQREFNTPDAPRTAAPVAAPKAAVAPAAPAEPKAPTRVASTRRTARTVEFDGGTHADDSGDFSGSLSRAFSTPQELEDSFEAESTSEESSAPAGVESFGDEGAGVLPALTD